MSIDAWRLTVTAAVAFAATAALALNALQFRRLERSLRGAAYQQLAGSAFDIKKILLEHEELEYLASSSSGNRQQEIFESLLRNYIESFWTQNQDGLLDAEVWTAFEGLLYLYASQHRSVIQGLVGGRNYAPSLRDYANQLLAETLPNQAFDLRDRLDRQGDSEGVTPEPQQ